MFESSVNSEGIETTKLIILHLLKFESSVNSEGIETNKQSYAELEQFESSVNSEGIETITAISIFSICLRAV